MSRSEKYSRRSVLRGLSCMAVCGITDRMMYPGKITGTAIPVLMFHKVEDVPRYPEDISPAHLEALLSYFWRSGYRPVNVSDILSGAVDVVVPRGFKPLGITVDDAHRSVLYAHPQRDALGSNSRSFMELFTASLAPYDAKPRASLFISRVNDDRVSKDVSHYFASSRSLQEHVGELTHIPGVELGYHTLSHARMTGMDARAVRDLLEAQREEFRRAGVLDAIAPVLAYPYGCPPTEQGIAALKDMGFKGAVLAFPGAHEAQYDDIPFCVYDGKLRTDPFFLPRVCIGAWTYNKKDALGGAYNSIEPLDDFRKDVENGAASCYVSQGFMRKPL